MRTWKKILTLIVFMMLACVTVSACGGDSKYDKMKIGVEVVGLEDNTITLSPDSSENFFTIKVTVDGVGDDVSKKVNFVVDNPGLLTILPPTTDGNVTTAKVIVNQVGELSSDSTIIRVSTAEGNKTDSVPVKIVIPLNDIIVHKSTMPLVRGEVLDDTIDTQNLNSYWSYFPSNTTHRGVSYEAKAIRTEDKDDVAKINEYFVNNKKLLIPASTNLKSFLLEITSDNPSALTGEKIVRQIIVDVLDKPDLSKLSILESSYADGNYPLLTRDENTGEYNLVLSLNYDSYANYRQSILAFEYDGAALSDFFADYYRFENDNANEEIITDTRAEYSVRVLNGKGKDSLVSVDIVDKDSFEIVRNNKQGTEELIFEIDYNGYENLFTPIRISVNVTTNAFPSEIKLFASKSDLDANRKPYRDNDIVLYKNGDSTEVWVGVFGDNSVLNNQPVALSVNDENVAILDRNNIDVEEIMGGSPIYLSKLGDISGEVTLTVTSQIFTDIQKTIKLSYINEDTVISTPSEKINVFLDPQEYDEEQTKANKVIDLINDGYVSFTGLPKTDDGVTNDYSGISVSIAEGSFAKYNYDSATNTMQLTVFNKIGHTRITFTTANGITATRDLIISYPFDDAGFIGLQFDNFDDYTTSIEENKDYVYSFKGSFDSSSVSGKTAMVVGSSYSFYYMLGDQQYTSIDNAIIKVNIPYCSDNTVIETNGRLITVKKYIESPVTLTFSFTKNNTLPGEENTTIYIVIEVDLIRTISSIATDFYDIKLYDLSTINRYAVNPSFDANGRKYIETHGTKNIPVTINPSNSNTWGKEDLNWNAGGVEGGYYTKSRINTSPETYEFTQASSDLIVRLSLDDSGLIGTLSVSYIPNDEFKFKLYLFVTQTFTSSEGEDVVEVIPLTINVTVVMAGTVSAISADVYNDTITFDIRNPKEYLTHTFNYNLVPIDNKEILIKDIRILTDSTDLSVTIINESQIKVTMNHISDGKKDNPIYEFYILANARLQDNNPENATFSNLNDYYDRWKKITVKVANGQSIPFEISSEADLIRMSDVVDYKDALTSNYVLTRNIYLDVNTNWKPIGTESNPFQGTLSGRYYTSEYVYSDYVIYNMNVKVDNRLLEATEVKEKTYYGLFGYLGSNAKVSHLKVYNYNFNITGYTNNNGVTYEYIGVIAGYNEGIIENCEVDNGTFVNGYNGNIINSNRGTLTSGISYTASEGGTSTITYIGGIAGYNNRNISNSIVRTLISIDNKKNNNKVVYAGGVVGYNIGNVINEEKRFVVTDGIKGFDVVVAINPHQDADKLNHSNYFGGVTGVNSGNAVVSNFAVRAFIYAMSNAYQLTEANAYALGGVGGISGYNNATIQNNIVIPNLIGMEDIGGLVGMATTGTNVNYTEFGSGLNIIESNKIQFIDFDDDYSYFNTGIYGYTNVGGLIGNYQIFIDNGMNIITSGEGNKVEEITFNNSIRYNSVTSYYTRKIDSYNYSSSDLYGMYYGDIVIGNDNNSQKSQYVGGLIGNSNDVMINSAYVKANIVFENDEQTYIGGVIGKAKGIVSIFNTSVYGEVINTNNTDSRNYVGGFVADATEINVCDYDLFTIYMNGSANIDDKYFVYKHTANDSLIPTIASLENLMNLKDCSFDIYDIVIRDIATKINYHFGNFVSSYSMLQITQVDFNDEDLDGNRNEIESSYVKNFVAVGGYIEVEPNNISGSNGVNEPAYMFIKIDDTYYATKSNLKFSTIVAYNSFYIGATLEFILFNVNEYVDIANISITENNVCKSTISKNNIGGVEYNLSLYGVELSGKKVFYYYPMNISGYANEYTESSISNNGISLMINMKATYEIGEEGNKKTIYLGSYGIYKDTTKLKDIYVCENTLSTGLNDNGELTEYYRYFNTQVNGGCPLSFSKNQFFMQGENKYVDVIIDLAPTKIELAEVTIDFENIWQSVTGNVDTITPSINTVFYYELDYNSLPTELKTINNNKVNVIDFNLDGIYSSIDADYSMALAAAIDNQNLYKISNLLGIDIMPPFIQNGMITFISSNPQIADIEIVDNDVYIRIKGVGSVTFSVYSAYNPDTAGVQFKLNIISAVTGFEVYKDASFEHIAEDIEVVIDKRSHIYIKTINDLDVNGATSDQLQRVLSAIAPYSKLPAISLIDFNNYNIRYFIYNNNSIINTDDLNTPARLFDINKQNFSKVYFDQSYGFSTGAYAYYIDAGNEPSIYGYQETVKDITLLAMPYIILDEEVVYLFDFASMTPTNVINNKYAKLINFNVVQGTDSISSNDKVEFRPVKKSSVTVEVTTGKSSATIDYVIKKDNNELKVITDAQLNELITFDNDKIYLKLVQVKFEEDKKLKTFKFDIGVMEDHLFDQDLIASYTIEFKTEIYDKSYSSSTTVVNVLRQEIESSFVKHYSSLDQYAENIKEEYSNNTYYESDTLVAGYAGMLRLDFITKYATYDTVEVSSDIIGGYYISLEQLVEVYESAGRYSQNIYRSYTDNRELNANTIKFGKVSYTYNINSKDNYVFDGALFLRTVVPTLPKGDYTFTLTIKCYYQGVEVYKTYKSINVLSLPEVNVELNNSSNIVAFGNSLNINLEADSEVEWTLTQDGTKISFDTISSNRMLVKDYNGYRLDIKKMSELGVPAYEKYLGKEYILTATASLDVKGRTYYVSDSVRFTIALFTIDKIGVRYVENGYFNGTYNQLYELRVQVLEASYDKEYNDANNNAIVQIIRQYEKEMSHVNNGTFQYKATDGLWHNLEAKQYDDFLIAKTGVGDYFTIKNNRRNTSSMLRAKISIKYTTSDTNNGVILNPVHYNNRDFVIENTIEFGLNFIRLSNEVNPEPIFSAEEFKNMDEGGYYILQSDITLKDWNPLNTAIAYLDGNSYVITIESFYDTKLERTPEDTANYELQLGIFSEISENTIIKNLNIEVKNTTLNIPVANYNKVEFGLLASVNNGIVTNVTAINNADSLRKERNELLTSNGVDVDTIEYSTNNEVSVINLNYGNVTSSATSNRIGGLVGVNYGYITNSSLNYISIKGLDYVAGFVAENVNVISSSYFLGGDVNAQVSAENTVTLGGAGFVFTNTGKIAYSYVSGSSGDKKSGIDYTDFAGEFYSNSGRMMNNSVISESGVACGFVFNNSGSINDSYSNIRVYGDKSVGFVYENSGNGTINNVYSLSSVLQSDSAHNPFIGLKENNTKANKSDTSSITNAYYLKVVANDLTGGEGGNITNDKTEEEAIDEFLNESLQIALPVSMKHMSEYSTFESFAFNSNYDDVTNSIKYEDRELNPYEEIARSVWFFVTPSMQDGDDSKDFRAYFKSHPYTTGVPQLVSPNLNTYSLKYYLSDNVNKIIDIVYSTILENNNLSILDISRNDIIPTISKAGSNRTIDIVFTLDSKTFKTINENTTLQANLESHIQNNIEESNLFNIETETISVNCSYTEETDNSDTVKESLYEYMSVLTNAGGVSIEYGNGILNPYLIKNDSDYNIYIKQTDETGINNTDRTFKSSKYLRLVSDISFNDKEITAETYNTIYSGVLDGNGMTISNLRINADSTKTSSAINEQYSERYDEKEKYNGVKATSVGMFAKLTNGAVVKNLNVQIDEIYGTGVNFVGIIAGQVIDSKIYNVTVTGSDIEVSGLNVVGGIAGRVAGKSMLINVNTNVSVTANKFTNHNSITKNNAPNINQIGQISKFNMYYPAIDDEIGYVPSNYYEVSIAGGIAGILDTDRDENDGGTLDTNSMGKIRYANNYGNIEILGEIVGGLFGYVGKDTVVTTSSVSVDTNTKLTASRVAGGIAGINLGRISRSFVANTKAIQDSIDKELNKISSVENQIYGDKLDTGSDSFYAGNPHFIGGIAGINKEGAIDNSYNRVNVINENSLYAGGIIGANIAGEMRAVYTTADVYSLWGVGGIIGLNAKYDDDVNNPDKGILSTLLNNYTIESRNYYDSLGEEKSEKYKDTTFTGSEVNATNISAVVAANIWSKEHLNTFRNHINSNLLNASVGAIIGYDETKGSIEGVEYDSNLTVDQLDDRLKSENVYTVTAYSYQSIVDFESPNNGANRTFAMLREIGNKSDKVVAIDDVTYDVSRDRIVSVRNSIDDSNALDNKYVLAGGVTASIDTSGDVVEYTDYIFSRFRTYSSSRTLREILNRVFLPEEEKMVLNSLGLPNEEYNSDFDYSYTYDDETITKTAKRQPMYPNSLWDLGIWGGIGITSTYGKSDAYILPTHENKVNDPIIYVYNYNDLQKVKLFPNGTFIVMNDFEIPSDKAQPLLTSGNPFTGTLKSDDKASNPYTITLKGMTTSNDFGIFAAIKGATIENLNINVTGDIVVKNNDNREIAGGVLFGYAYAKGNMPNTISKVNIKFVDGAKITNDSNESKSSISYLGSIGGNAESLLVKEVTVNNPVIRVKSGSETTSSPIKMTSRNIYIGGLFGYVSMFDGSDNIANTGADLELNLSFENNKSNPYNNMGIGGLFGKMVNSPVEGKHISANNIVSNTKIDINLSRVDETQDVTFANIGIGGAIGWIEGIDEKYTFNLAGISYTGNCNVANNGIYAESGNDDKGNLSVGGIIGIVGSKFGGYVNISFKNNTENTNIAYIHNGRLYNKEVYSHRNINVGSLVGSAYLVQTDNTNGLSGLNDGNGSTSIKFYLNEIGNADISYGGLIGRLYGGDSSLLLNNTAVEFTGSSSLGEDKVIIGENTKLSISKIIGQAINAKISKSGGNGSNLDVVIKEGVNNNNIRIGGLFGFISGDTHIDQCFTSYTINYYIESDISKAKANIGGLVGFAQDRLNITNSYTTGRIISDDNYETIGGMVGKISVSDGETLDNISTKNIYTTVHIVAPAFVDNVTRLGGLVGKATGVNNIAGSEDIDISGDIANKFVNSYYMADFIVETSNIGTPLSASDMICGRFNNIEFTESNDIWQIAEEHVDGGKYHYPKLKWMTMYYTDFSTNVDFVFNSIDETNNNIVIINNGSSYSITTNTSDIIILNPGSILNVVNNAKFGRIYGFASSGMSEIVNNEGYVSSITYTVKNNYSTGVIINSDSTVDSNAGLIIYSDLQNVPSGTGTIRLSKVKGLTRTLSQKVYDSYNGTNLYMVDSSNGKYVESDGSDITKFSNNFDFIKVWTAGTSLNNGKVSLLWELKNAARQRWFSEDIDLNSTTQTKYATYVWSNYLNTLSNEVYEGLNIADGKIDSIEELIKYSREVNLGNYLNLDVSITSNIDLSGKIFTPIGGQDIFGVTNNIPTANFDGGEKTIKGLLVINDGDTGLFGVSNSSNYANIKFDNPIVISRNGNAGVLLGKQIHGTNVSNIDVTNSKVMVTHNEESSAGGIVGLIDCNTASQNILTLKYLNVDSGYVARANNAGGVVGKITGANKVEINYVNVKNTGNSVVKGLSNAGGIIGNLANNSKVTTIYRSMNNASVFGSIAGGLIGKAEYTTLNINEAYNVAYIKGNIYSAGLVGYTNYEITIENAYASRGSEGTTFAESSVVTTDDSNFNTSIITGGTSSTLANIDGSSQIKLHSVYSPFEGKQLLNVTNLTDNSKNYFTYGIGSSSDLTSYQYKTLILYGDRWPYLWNRITSLNCNYPVLTFDVKTVDAVEAETIDQPSYDSMVANDDIDPHPVKDRETGLTEKIYKNIYSIDSEAKLAWVTEQVNAGNTFAGDLLVLNAPGKQLDFAGYQWISIGYDETHSFQGTFDFNNHTIYNLSCWGFYENDDLDNETMHKINNVGLFGYTNGATMLGNLTFASSGNNRSTISALGNNVGAFIGYAKDTVINGCIINDGIDLYGYGRNVDELEESNGIGGLIGTYEYSTMDKNTDSNCLWSINTLINNGNVSKLKYLDTLKFVETIDYMGGVIGRIVVGDTYDTIKIFNLTNTGTVENTISAIGGTVGYVSADKTNIKFYILNNSGNVTSGNENLTASPYVGGLIGLGVTENNANIITKSNKIAEDTEITNLNSKANVGGIIGAYDNSNGSGGYFDIDTRPMKVKDVWYDNGSGPVYADDETELDCNIEYTGYKINSGLTDNRKVYDSSTDTIFGTGGLVGNAQKVRLILSSQGLKLSNITFVNSDTKHASQVGGAFGYVSTLYMLSDKDYSADSDFAKDTSQTDDPRVDIKNIEITGVSNIGGFAGYVEELLTQESATSRSNTGLSAFSNPIKLNNITIQDNLDNDRAKNQGGLFGGINGGDIVLEDITANNLFVMSNDNDAVGGLFGGIHNSTQNIKLSNINLDIKHICGYGNIGGVAGYVNVRQFVNMNNIGVVIGNLSSAQGYAGGIVGECYGGAVRDSQDIFATVNLSTIENVDVKITGDINMTGEYSYFGGVAGGMRDTSIYEAFADFSETMTFNSGSNSNSKAHFSGIVAEANTDYANHDSKKLQVYNANWCVLTGTNEDKLQPFSNDCKNVLKQNDYKYGLYASYTDATIDTGYHETVIGKGTSTLTDTQLQLFRESGVWSVSDTTIALKSRELRSPKTPVMDNDRVFNITLNKSGEGENIYNTYEDMYNALTKRYGYYIAPINLNITVSSEIDIYTEAEKDADGNITKAYLRPLGTYYFPIGNLTLNGSAGTNLVIAYDEMLAGSGRFGYDKKYLTNFGMFGFINNYVEINNISIFGNNKDISLTGYAGDKLHSSLLISDITGFSDNKYIFNNINITNIGNITNNTTGTEESIFGGVVGNTFEICYIDEITSENEENDYIISNITTSSVLGKNISGFEIAGGIFGKISGSFGSAELDARGEYCNVRISTNGWIRNNLNIMSNEIAGGIVGYMADSVVTSFDDSGLSAVEKIDNIWYNNGNIYADKYAGGVIGYAGAYNHTFKRLQSGVRLLGTKYAISDSPSTISGEYAGGIIGYLRLHSEIYGWNPDICIENNRNGSSVISNNSSYNGVLGGIIGLIDSDMSYSSSIKLVNNINVGEVGDSKTTDLTSYDSGGIVGAFDDDSATNSNILFDNCINSATVGADGGNAGGLVSQVDSINLIIKNCYSYGSIYSSNCAGGYIGSLVNVNVSELSQSKSDSTINYKINTNSYIGSTVDSIEHSYQVSRIAGGMFGYVDGCSFEGNITTGNLSASEMNNSSGPKLYTPEKTTILGATASGFIGKIVNTSKLTFVRCINRTNVDSDKYYSGGLASLQEDSASVELRAYLCENSGNIRARYTGGIFGWSNEEIQDCTNTGKIEGVGSHNSAGGIVGFGLDVYDCVNRGKIDGYFAGGIAGTNYGLIENCENKGEITGDDSAGGIAGSVYSTTISLCKNEGVITGDNGAGGIVGISNLASAEIILCNNEGNVLAGDSAGGILGKSIDLSYYSSASDKLYGNSVMNCNIQAIYPSSGQKAVGGLVGYSQSNLEIGAYKIDKNYTSNSINSIHLSGAYVGGVVGKLSGDSYYTPIISIDSVGFDACYIDSYHINYTLNGYTGDTLGRIIGLIHGYVDCTLWFNSIDNYNGVYYYTMFDEYNLLNVEIGMAVHFYSGTESIKSKQHEETFSSEPDIGLGNYEILQSYA